MRLRRGQTTCSWSLILRWAESAATFAQLTEHVTMKRLLVILPVIAAATLTSRVEAQTLGCTVDTTNGGSLPAAGTGGGGAFPLTLPPFSASFVLHVASIPSGATVVSAVNLHNLHHAWSGDLQFVLTDPSGVTHNLITMMGNSCQLNGNYSVVSSCTGGLAAPDCSIGGPGASPGAYQQYFGSWPSGTHGIHNTPLDSIPAMPGDWILTAYDWLSGISGSLSGFGVCFGTGQSPSAPSGTPHLVAPPDSVTVFGPTVHLFSTDIECARGYEFEIDNVVYPSGYATFPYTSSVGTHSWRVRATNVSGVSPWSSVRTFTDNGAAPTACGGAELDTVGFIGGNGLSSNSAVFFDLNVLNPLGITLAQLDTNTNAPVGMNFGIKVYTKSGTYVGSEQNAGAWSLAAVGAGVSVGASAGSVVEFGDIPLAPGVTGVALQIIGGGHRYTNGNGSNQAYSNSDLSISLGKAQELLFVSTPFSPRVWNGTLRYNCGGGSSVTYCTSSTSTNGCVPSITSTGQPSASLSSGFVLGVAGVEGNKAGLFYYGISGRSASIWASGSTSFLCVKAPTQRMGAQNAGGADGACDGVLTEDWNAYIANHPSALGQPFSQGETAWAQAWFRDPAAPKTTNLSNALEFTLAP